MTVPESRRGTSQSRFARAPAWVRWPIELIEAATERVPAMKFAFALVALAAAMGLAVLLLRGGNVWVALPYGLGVMVLLVIFAKIAQLSGERLLLPAMFLVWSVTILSVAAAVVLGWRYLNQGSGEGGVPQPVVQERPQPEKPASSAPKEVVPRPAPALVARVLVSGRTRLLVDPQTIKETVSFNGRNTVATQKVDIPAGFEWNQKVNPKLIAQPSGEKGTCGAVRFDAQGALAVSASLEEVHKGLDTRNAHVQCTVQAIRFAVEYKEFELDAQDLHEGGLARFELPAHWFDYHAVVMPLNAPTEDLSDANPLGSIGRVTRASNWVTVQSNR